jgi:hypothetical protein
MSQTKIRLLLRFEWEEYETKKFGTLPTSKLHLLEAGLTRKSNLSLYTYDVINKSTIISVTVT